MLVKYERLKLSPKVTFEDFLGCHTIFEHDQTHYQKMSHERK